LRDSAGLAMMASPGFPQVVHAAWGGTRTAWIDIWLSQILYHSLLQSANWTARNQQL